MKRKWQVIFSTFIFMIFFVNPSIAIESLGPQISIEEQEFDFKEVKQGDIIEHSFIVKNVGDQPLEIKSVKPG